MSWAVTLKHPFSVDVLIPVPGGRLRVPMLLTIDSVEFGHPLQMGELYSMTARVDSYTWDKPTMEWAP